jgi:nitrate reductase gamma subunit
MPSLSLLLGCLPYLTVAVVLFGLTRRLVRWSRAAPGLAPLFPAATARPAAWARLAGEVCLLRGRRALPGLRPVVAWSLHAALVLLALGHLRAVTDFPRLWAWLGLSPAAVDRLADAVGGAVGLAALAALLILALWRLGAPRLRAVTRTGDVLALVLLGAVLFSGLIMRLGGPVDLGSVRAYLFALATLHPVPLPDVPGFAAHFLLAQALALLIPYGKLLHMLAVFPAKAGLFADPLRPGL